MPDTPPDETDSTPAPETPAVPVEQSTAPPPSLDKPKKSRRTLKLSLLLLILIIVAGGVVYAIKAHHKSTNTTVKKDIPYLTYGFSNTGDIVPAYPLESADTTDTIFVDSQVYEGLTGYANQTRVVPLLASSWETPNSDTWVFNIRHNVKFHNGHTLTAADVKYSLDYAVAHQSADDSATAMFEASTIKSVSVTNPYQVKIVTNGPDAVLLARLASLYIFDSKAKLGDSNAGTGPYTVTASSTNADTSSVNLSAFDSYWGGHVYTRKVHIQEVPTFTQLATDTAKGQFDISGDYNAAEQATIKAKVAYYQPIPVTDLGISYITLNTENTSSPLHTLAARQAMNYALSPQAILKAAGIDGVPVNQIIPPSLPGYDPSIKTIPYDPAQARKLLATVPNASQPLTLEFPSGDERQIAEIAKELDAVGFNIKTVDLTSIGDLVNDDIAGKSDMFYLAYTTNTLDGLDLINNIVIGSQNFSDPAVTDLVNQASQTIDANARLVDVQKVERLISSEDPTIPLYSQTRTYVLTKHYVTNVALPSLDAGMYFWQVYQK